MRDPIAKLIAHYLLAGHSVTVMCGVTSKQNTVRRMITRAICDGVGRSVLKSVGDYAVEMRTGARLQIGQLQTYSGSAMEHTPVVVLLDVQLSNVCLVPDARAIACPFPNGDPAILIEA